MPASSFVVLFMMPDIVKLTIMEIPKRKLTSFSCQFEREMMYELAQSDHVSVFVVGKLPDTVLPRSGLETQN